MSSTTSRCAACRYLRRRCPQDCVFSAYFPSNDPQRFSAVHRIYGASNVGKMLQQIPEGARSQAADSLHYEALRRIQDPVYGSVGVISWLQRQIHDVEKEIAKTRAEITVFLNTNTAISELSVQHLQTGGRITENMSDKQRVPGQSVHGVSTQTPWFE